MTDTKWTSGPWTIDPRATTRVIAQDRPICSINFLDNLRVNETIAENVANIHLITAAPDLYEALDTFIDWWIEETNAVDPRLGHQVASDQRIQNAVDVLIKARGETNE